MNITPVAVEIGRNVQSQLEGMPNGEIVPSPGCLVGCAYCNQHFYNFQPNIGRVVDVISPGIDVGISVNTAAVLGNKCLAEIDGNDAIDLLLQSPYYRRDKTVVFENFNDPGLNWAKTLQMMRLIRQKSGHTGPLLALTKLAISDQVAGELSGIIEDGARPIVVVSHGGLPRKLEPGSSAETRVTAMRRLKTHGVPVIHSMRPLIHSINSNDKQLQEVLDQTAEYAEVIVPGGLVVDDSTRQVFDRRGFPLAEEYYKSRYQGHADIFPNEMQVFSTIRKHLSQLGYNVPINKYMSCAVSIVMTEYYGRPLPDKLAHWAGIGAEANGWLDCDKMCTPAQIETCKVTSKKTQQEVEFATRNRILLTSGKQMEVSTDTGQDGIVAVNGLLSRTDLYDITNETGWYAVNLPSLGEFTVGANIIIKEKLNLDFSSICKALTKKEDGWEVDFIDDIDDQVAEDTIRYLRGLMMTRVTRNKKQNKDEK